MSIFIALLVSLQHPHSSTVPKSISFPCHRQQTFHRLSPALFVVPVDNATVVVPVEQTFIYSALTNGLSRGGIEASCDIDTIQGFYPENICKQNVISKNIHTHACTYIMRDINYIIVSVFRYSRVASHIARSDTPSITCVVTRFSHSDTPTLL